MKRALLPRLLAAGSLALACHPGSEREPAPRARAGAPFDRTVPELEVSELEAPELEAPAVESPAEEPEPPAPESPPIIAGPHLESHACPECAALESGFAERCVMRVDDALREPLGCGVIAASGRFGYLIKETGEIDADSWRLTSRYIDVAGRTVREGPGCESEPSFDCEAPGSFLPIGDGRYVHFQGNAGDGSNENALIDLVRRRRHKLPDGEYAVIPHPSRPVVGFFAVIPNFTTPRGEPAVRLQLGCFDLAAARLDAGEPTLLLEDDIDPIHEADPPRWQGDQLIVTPAGRAPLEHRCKAAG